MANAWEKLVELYDKLEEAGKPVCPIAHTYIRGRKSRSELRAWIDEKYPGEWEKFIEILENE